MAGCVRRPLATPDQRIGARCDFSPARSGSGSASWWLRWSPSRSAGLDAETTWLARITDAIIAARMSEERIAASQCYVSQEVEINRMLAERDAG